MNFLLTPDRNNKIYMTHFLPYYKITFNRVHIYPILAPKRSEIHPACKTFWKRAIGHQLFYILWTVQPYGGLQWSSLTQFLYEIRRMTNPLAELWHNDWVQGDQLLLTLTLIDVCINSEIFPLSKPSIERYLQIYKYKKNL